LIKVPERVHRRLAKRILANLRTSGFVKLV
jgi:hypothetical protein